MAECRNCPWHSQALLSQHPKKEFRMQSPSLPVQSWLHAVWHHKTAIVGGTLAIVSLALAHYAGFLMNVPLQLVAVVGLPLAKGVTATFLFYLFFCAVSARVIASIVQLAVLPIFALLDRFGRGFRRKMDFSQQRHFVRTHSHTIEWEGFAWILIQGLLFLLLIFGIYVKFSIDWVSASEVVVSVAFAVLSGLVRSGFFLQPKPATFKRKIKTRTARYGRAVSAAFVTTTAALIIVAYILGGLRASLLRDQEPQMIVTKEFTGKASIIASSEGALLLFQKQGTALRYIYSAPEFATSMETNSVFPPIGAKKDE